MENPKSYMESFMTDMGTLKDVSGSFTTLQETIDPVVTQLSEMEQSLSFIPDVSEGITQVQSVLEPFLGVLGGTANTLNTISSAVTGFMPMMQELQSIFSGLFTTLLNNPFVLVITLITLLAATFLYLWSTSETFRDIVIGVWESIKAFMMPIIQEIVGFVMTIWGSLTTWWIENQALIMQTFKTIWSAIRTVITTVIGFLLPYLTTAWQLISTAITNVWNVIKTTITIAMEIIKGVITTIMKVITGDWSGAWETIKSMFSNVWEIMKSFVVMKATEIWQMIKNKFTQIKDTISSLMSNAKNAVVQGFITMVTNAMTKAQEIVSAVRQKFQEVFQAVRTKLAAAVVEVGTQIAKMPGKVLELAGRMVSAGKDLIMGLINGIKEKATGVATAALDAAKKAVNGVLSFLGIKSPSRLFRTIGDDTMAGFAMGIDHMSKKVVDSAVAVSDKVQDSFNPQFSMPNISGQISNVNRAANQRMENHMTNEWVHKQPAHVNVAIGGQQFSAFVEDITKVQGRQRLIKKNFE